MASERVEERHRACLTTSPKAFSSQHEAIRKYGGPLAMSTQRLLRRPLQADFLAMTALSCVSPKSRKATYEMSPCKCLIELGLASGQGSA